MNTEEWTEARAVGYTPRTDLWDRFCRAEGGGEAGVRSLYIDAFARYRDDVAALADLVMVLNHRLWRHHRRGDDLAAVYSDLWCQAHDWCIDHLHGDDLRRYLSVVD